MLWVAAGVFLAVAVLAELGWRQLGFSPSVRVGLDGWCTERDHVYGDRAIVLVGSSRVLFDVSIPVLHERLPGREVAQLAVGASLGGAVLRDLAADPDFHGVVIASMVALAFEPWQWETQQDHVDYCHDDWTLERRLSERIWTSLASRLVVLNPSLNLRQLLRQPLDFDRWLPGSGMVFRADRGIDSDFSRRTLVKNPAWLRAQFNRRRRVRSEPASWLEHARSVEKWIEQIQSRGGRVAVVRFPSGGLVWEYDEKLYPRRTYWDRFAGGTSAITLHFLDVPAWRGIALPDDSHIDVRDKRAFTETLVDELQARGLFGAPQASRNSTQLPSGSSTMAMRIPGRISVAGTTTLCPASPQLLTSASRLETEIVQ